jgi:hypothetical protein
VDKLLLPVVTPPEQIMPHRRKVKEGSFGAHFDEVVKHFPQAPPPNGAQGPADKARLLQEKRDIHTLLFEQAWQIDPEPHDRDAR